MKRVIVCPDLHVDVHDKRAWRLFLQVVEAVKPDIFVWIGDIGDFHSVSSHSRDPERQKYLLKEVEAVRRELDKVEALSIPRVIYCIGNHEERLERYIRDKAPDLFGLVDVDSVLQLSQRGWEVVPYRQFTKVGKMAFTHDVGRHGKHALAQSLQDFGGNITIGHIHRGGTAYLGTAQGESHVGLSVGWLGDVKRIDYRHQALARREWQLGFGVVDIESNGNCHAQFIPIVNYRCVVDRNVFKG